MKNIIKVNDTEVQNIHVQVISAEVDRHIENRATITFDYDKLQEFPHDNLLKPINIEVITEDGKRAFFRGLVSEAYRLDDETILECSGFEQYMRESMVKDMFLNFTIQEIAYYLITHISELGASESTIQGLRLDKNEREFLLMVPILNLDLDYDLVFDNISFRRPKNDDEDDNIVRKEIRPTQDWKDDVCRARTRVTTSDFADAVMKGRKAISRMLDLLSFRVNLSSLTYLRNHTPIFCEWDRRKMFSRPELSSQTYVRDLTKSKPKVWVTDVNTISGMETLDVLKTDKKYFEQTVDILRPLISERSDEKKNRILTALYWLRLARYEEDLATKLLDYWISMEFLLAGQKADSAVSDVERNLIQRLIGEFEISEDRKKSITEKVDNCISMPTLKDRFESFIKTHNVEISDEDRGVVWEGDEGLRNQRNAIEHGRTVEVKAENLATMDFVIARMVLGVIAGM